MRTDYRALIEAAARHHGLDPNLVEALVLIESSGHTDAFRHEPGFFRKYLADNPDYAQWLPRRASSSYGLMQVLFPTARELGFIGEPELLFVPHIGLEYGCKRLRQMLDLRKGDVRAALADYNDGPASTITTQGAVYAEKVLTMLPLVQAARATGVHG